jgi:predicted O-methyltransferase YrrM
MSEYLVLNTSPTDEWICSGKGLLLLLQGKGPQVGLEIGCAEGHTTHYLLRNLPELVLHGIDPYVNYQDWNGRFLSDRVDMHQQILDYCAEFGDRFIMHRDFSDNMVNHFEDASLDFIFIDGIHTYEQVTIDCENYFSKVKSGGVFAGHDYNVIEGVNRAVNEFAAKHGAEVQTCPNDVWYWIKK